MNWFHDLFIEEAKPALERHSGGGEPINNQDKTITQNGTYTADEGFTGLGTVKVSVAREDQTDIEGVLNGVISRSITEISSNAPSIGNSAFSSYTILATANFPVATSIGNYAFQNCSALTEVNFPVATSIGNYAFQNCSALTEVNFPAATSIGERAFGSCSKLATVNFPVATSLGRYAFYDCSKLTSADFPTMTSVGSYAFQNCKSLTTVNFPLVRTVGDRGFEVCTKLSKVDFPALISIGQYGLSSCCSLTVLILRSETMCTISASNTFNGCYHILGTVNSTYNPEGLKDGYIYVPRALVDTYKAATNWSTFATQFRALEDYTVDGTITGELDSTKI